MRLHHIYNILNIRMILYYLIHAVHSVSWFSSTAYQPAIVMCVNYL